MPRAARLRSGAAKHPDRPDLRRRVRGHGRLRLRRRPFLPRLLPGHRLQRRGPARQLRAERGLERNRHRPLRHQCAGPGMALRAQPAQPDRAPRRKQARLLPRHQHRRQGRHRPGALQHPARIGRPYFSKLECFCFKNQTIQPGETVEFPVVYFVDPRYAADRDAKAAGPITLSYTFFPAVTGARADSSAAKPPSALGAPPRAGL